VIAQLAAGFVDDARHRSLRAACVRVARVAASAVTHPGLLRQVLADPTCRRHVAAVAPRDAFFFASHRSYLVSGLGRRARSRAALAHYRNETLALDREYQEAVYQGGGLVLWRRAHEETSFEIRLGPGSDVLYEGGLSLTFFVDGQRITVLSYSNVEPSLLDGRRPPGDPDGPPEPLLPLVARWQSSSHPFRRAFTDAFGRGTPGHLCLAALEGIALAQGSRVLRGVPASRHPALPLPDSGGLGHFESVYDGIWRSFAGARTGPLAWEIPLPLAPTPLAELTAKNRRRALKLRRHLASVREAAYLAYRARMLRPPPWARLPAREEALAGPGVEGPDGDRTEAGEPGTEDEVDGAA
jgi:uncharacterized protein VirK/YbjX